MGLHVKVVTFKSISELEKKVNKKKVVKTNTEKKTGK